MYFEMSEHPLKVLLRHAFVLSCFDNREFLSLQEGCSNSQHVITDNQFNC